jgi:hypothetical protein
MSDSVENLLVRTLYEVFGERDAARRKAAIETIFAIEAPCFWIRRAGTLDIAAWKRP